MQKAKSVVHCGLFSKAVAQEKLSIHMKEDLEKTKKQNVNEDSTSTSHNIHIYIWICERMCKREKNLNNLKTASSQESPSFYISNP